MSTLRVLVISLLIAVSASYGKEVSRRTFANWKAMRGLERNSVQDPARLCTKAVDLGLVMDRSVRDTYPTGWDDIMEFNRKLVSKFAITDDYDMTTVGAISFDQSAEVLLHFDDLHQDKDLSLGGVYKKMNTWQSGSHDQNTVIDRALDLARTDLFTDDEGARGHFEVLVLLTYGRQNSTAAAAAARRLEVERGVTVLVVGFGPSDPIELLKIAGAMTDHGYDAEKANNVFIVNGPDQVEEVAKQVAEAACNVRPAHA